MSPYSILRSIAEESSGFVLQPFWLTFFKHGSSVGPHFSDIFNFGQLFFMYMTGVKLNPKHIPATIHIVTPLQQGTDRHHTMYEKQNPTFLTDFLHTWIYSTFFRNVQSGIIILDVYDRGKVCSIQRTRHKTHRHSAKIHNTLH